jgi:L-amino acid N-acyltransferase YncA
MSEGRSRFRVEEMRESDWPVVAVIYAEGISTGSATFETAVPAYEAWDAAHLARPRLVLWSGTSLVGWAALAPVSARPAYRGVAEDTLYVAESARGIGAGTALLRALVEQAEGDGIWTLQAAIFAENRASVALHERCGFRVVGTRERIGRLNGSWRDIVLMERRSAVAG